MNVTFHGMTWTVSSESEITLLAAVLNAALKRAA
jgi:hypothetical protein